MTLVLTITAIVLGALLVVSVGGGLVVLLAYGLGWLLTRFLPFTPFEATLLSLIGMSAAGIAGWRVLTTVVSLPTPLLESEEEEDYDDEAWEDEFEDADSESAAPEADDIPAIPRWRQPIKKVDFSGAKPDDRCPCGSGRKYKNCHGRKMKRDKKN